jgi:hypothetical protein
MIYSMQAVDICLLSLTNAQVCQLYVSIKTSIYAFDKQRIKKRTLLHVEHGYELVYKHLLLLQVVVVSLQVTQQHVQLLTLSIIFIDLY